MRVDVAFINVSADHYLIIGQVFSSKFLCNLQCQFRRDFPRFEGLDDVITLPAVQLSNLDFRVHHLPVLPPRITVLVGGENTVFGLIPIQRVLNCLI